MKTAKIYTRKLTEYQDVELDMLINMKVMCGKTFSVYTLPIRGKACGQKRKEGWEVSTGLWYSFFFLHNQHT